MNLLDTVSGFLTPNFVSKLMGSTEMSGESSASVERAMQSSVPTILAGLTQVAASPGGAARVYSAVTQGDHIKTLDQLGSLTSDDTAAMATSGQGFLSGLFGNKTSGLVDLIAKSSGIRSSVASGIFGAVGAIIAGVLARTAATRGLNPQGLLTMLMDNRRSVIDSPYAPSGLANALGLGSLSNLGGAAVETGREYPLRPVATSRKPASRWTGALLLPLLGALALGAWALARHRSNVAVVEPPPVVEKLKITNVEMPATPATDQPKTAAQSSRDMVAKTVDKIRDPKGIQRLKDITSESFYYDFASTSPSSAGRLDEIVTLMQSNPSARLRLEGHTDNVGDQASNRRVSEKRANDLKKQLTDRGVAAERIEVIGVGDTQPMTSNESDEGRAKNRRVDVLVLESATQP